MIKKLLSIILSVAVALTMMPAMAGISFAGEANTTVPVELVKAQTSGSKAIKLSWTKVSGATKYVVYGQKCDKSYKKLKTTSGTSYKVKKIKGKKLRAHKTYKFYVVAYSGSKKLVTSKGIHFITGKTMGKYANARSISINKTSLTLEPGKTATLKATTKIYNNKKHIKKSHGAATRYISNNPTVASVNSKGVITAKKEGTATIYVQDIGGLWCKTIVTVKASEPIVVNVTGVSLDKRELTITVGDPDTRLTATVAPDNATDKSVTWSSSNESVATVDQNGNVHAVAAGEAAITVTTVDGNKTDTCEVTVGAHVTGVSLDKRKLTITVGDPDTRLTAIVAPDNATDKSVTWSSSNESVATVDQNGNVHAVAAGEATITVTTVDGNKTDTCEVTAIDEADYKMKTGTTWFSTLTSRTEITKASITDIIFCKEVPTGEKAVGGVDLTADETGKVKGYVVADGDKYKIYVVGDYIFGNADCRQMFDGFSNLTTLDFGHFDTSNVTDMSGMFSGCSNLTSLDLSELNTSSVQDMSGMFFRCSNLTSLDLSELETSSVWNMSQMFFGCSNLTSLDLSELETSSVRNMSQMFFECSNLTSLDFGNFDTSNVTNMGQMFYGCSNLTSLDLSELETSSVWNMSQMFFECSKLASIEFGNFDTSSVEDMKGMFERCGANPSVQDFTLDLSGWSVASVMECSWVFDSAGVFARNWSVTIPAKTGNKDNDATHWYVGEGTKYIEPAPGKQFTLAQ